nr:2-haloacid dehalogenase [Rhizobium sp.]
MLNAAYFPQISQSDVGGEMEATYENIRQTLRVPWVAFACRVLATVPEYLPVAWARTAEAMSTRYAEQAADELRERSLLSIEPKVDLKKRLRGAGWDNAQIEEVRRVVNAFNYGNPKYIMMITALCESFNLRPVGGGDLSVELRSSVPKGHPEGMDPLLSLVNANEAPPEVQTLLKRAADLHYHHGPASDFQALANWPEFLQIATDEALAPVVRTETFDLKARELIHRARELVQGLPGQVGIGRAELMSTCTPGEIAGLTGILFMYQRFIPDITISLIRIGECLDGSEAAAKSPFPV